jgi:hypothetical protein
MIEDRMSVERGCGDTIGDTIISTKKENFYVVRKIHFLECSRKYLGVSK